MYYAVQLGYSQTLNLYHIILRRIACHLAVAVIMQSDVIVVKGTCKFWSEVGYSNEQLMSQHVASHFRKQKLFCTLNDFTKKNYCSHWKFSSTTTLHELWRFYIYCFSKQVHSRTFYDLPVFQQYLNFPFKNCSSKIFSNSFMLIINMFRRIYLNFAF